jgi:myo-inositol-1(or 4)-monophosphatase
VTDIHETLFSIRKIGHHWPFSWFVVPFHPITVCGLASPRPATHFVHPAPNTGTISKVENSDLLVLLHAAADAVAEVVSACGADEREQRARGHDDQFAVDVLADRAAVEVLLAGGVGVLSEESGLHAGERPVLVVLDPIDGSTNCSRGLDPYGPSMCACGADGLLAALVANLATGERHTAARGGGAWHDGARIVGRERDDLLIVATGDPMPWLEPVVWTRVSGASAHDLCRVADGRFDAYVDERNTQSVWDYLAATLVLLEVGGTVHERDGKVLFDLAARADRRLVAAGTDAQLALMEGLLNSASADGRSTGQPTSGAVPDA